MSNTTESTASLAAPPHSSGWAPQGNIMGYEGFRIVEGPLSLTTHPQQKQQCYDHHQLLAEGHISRTEALPSTSPSSSLYYTPSSMATAPLSGISSYPAGPYSSCRALVHPQEHQQPSIVHISSSEITTNSIPYSQCYNRIICSCALPLCQQE
ncbi:hypothetical protein ACA910_019539 [Epithemia clementina (nom. ined.)]